MKKLFIVLTCILALAFATPALAFDWVSANQSSGALADHWTGTWATAEQEGTQVAIGYDGAEAFAKGGSLVLINPDNGPWDHTASAFAVTGGYGKVLDGCFGIYFGSGEAEHGTLSRSYYPGSTSIAGTGGTASYHTINAGPSYRGSASYGVAMTGGHAVTGYNFAASSSFSYAKTGSTGGQVD